MGFLRNTEIKRPVILQLLVTAAAWAAARYLFDTRTAVYVAAVCGIFLFIFIMTTWRRYRYIAALSKNIDAILHGGNETKLMEYKEGELAILYDELHKVMKRMREQNERLIQDKCYLSDSIADISHQIRTPLTSTNLIVDFLRKPDLTEERRLELATDLTRLLVRMDRLITSLLKISRLDTGTVSFHQEKVAVKDLLHQAAEPLLIPMELKEQEFIVCQKGTECYEGDLSWSAEAVGNILKNCMEHTPKGGKIEVLAEENTIYTELVIRDNGSGIAPEDLPHLFERFYKGQNAGSESFGIGLALARMIIVRQNGTIKVSNRKEGGACFTIRFYHRIV